MWSLTLCLLLLSSVPFLLGLLPLQDGLLLGTLLLGLLSLQDNLLLSALLLGPLALFLLHPSSSPFLFGLLMLFLYRLPFHFR